MKKLLFLLLFVSKLTFSQSKKGFVQYGALAGVNFVNLYGNPFIETFLKSATRVVVGPSVYYPLSNHWAVKSNLFYESKGAGGIMPLFDEEGEPLGFFNAEIHYNYLTIPLLFDFTFGRKLKGNLSAGPFVGVLIHQRSVFTSRYWGSDGKKRYGRILPLGWWSCFWCRTSICCKQESNLKF
ncbi:MAG: PorT family protein [Bacteroidetes bacterium]|nr:PorT family protein [Bacteroidota bacterium]